MSGLASFEGRQRFDQSRRRCDLRARKAEV